MAFRYSALLQIFRTSSIIRLNSKVPLKEYKTAEKITYLEDPDTFGTLSIHKTRIQNDIKEDEGDLKEEEFLQNKPMPSQKFTTRQYANVIKQYLQSKRIKEAIDVLEVRMLKEDRVKPENYIYNILIGACGEVGYTKKAFKLYNDMKRRALKATGDTYTCLFEACCNSPWPQDGLKNATHLRNFMIEKGIEPNLTNYNAMIKAFGRCGDITTAFKIIDEMRSKKIKLRVHTFNHLLQACITDKNAGLRHALIVWRKMLKMREKPNIFSFNLMLKCVKECNLGSKEDLLDLIGVIEEHIVLTSKPTKKIQSPLNKSFKTNKENAQLLIASEEPHAVTVNQDLPLKINLRNNENDIALESNIQEEITDVATINNYTTLQFVEHSPSKLTTKGEERLAPNLLSKSLQIDQVLGLKEILTVQDRFAIIGGQEDFLKEMESYSVPPDIKTFTQMLAVIDDTKKAEITLIETMKSANVRADIDFYNMLIKKRALRYDYDGALEVKDMIAEENKIRKKKHPAKKKIQLKLNIMSYGVLAMACKTKESAEKLLSDMEEEQVKVNIEILGSLLRQALTNFHFGYALYIMNIMTENNIKVNSRIIKHLETFNERCAGIIEQGSKNKKCTDKFIFGYQRFEKMYKNWLKEINIEEVLQTEHPWQQFKEPHPETVQRQPFQIKQPTKFYKRSRKFVPYKPKI